MDFSTPPLPKERQSHSGFPVYGTQSWAGSDEWHRELQSGLADKKYREMLDNHGLIGTAFQLFTCLAQQASWTIAPADATPEAEAVAETVRAAWNKLETTWHQVLAELLTALPWGWSWHEVVYTGSSRGITGWKGLYFVRQDTRQTWLWDEAGQEVLALHQLTKGGKTAVLPRAKALHFVPDTTTGSPEGRPWLRRLYRDYRDQLQLRTATLVGVQKDATGMAVLSVPAETWIKAADGDSTATTLVADAKAGVVRLQRGEREGIVLPAEKDQEGNPTGWGIELLKGGGQRQFDHAKLDEQCEQRIAITLLVQFLLLGQKKAGSFALSSDQTELLGIAIGASLDTLCETVTSQLFRPFMGLLGLDPELCPKLTHGPIEGPDLGALAALLKVGLEAGALEADQSLKDFVREQLGLPAKTATSEGL
jgi:hypothetical protein